MGLQHCKTALYCQDIVAIIHAVDSYKLPVSDFRNLPRLNIFQKTFNKLTRSLNINPNVKENYYQICNQYRTGIDTCDTHKRWQLWLAVFVSRYDPVKAKIDDLLKRHINDYDEWQRMMLNLNDQVNDSEYAKFLTTNGKFIERQRSEIASRMIVDTLEKKKIQGETNAFVDSLQNAGDRKDFLAIKRFSYVWIDHLVKGYAVTKSILYHQNETIELYEILENAMVECQEYK